MLLKTTSFARAGLLGNPSDGYFGKTVSFAFANVRADVTLYESPRVQILPNGVDDAVFDDLAGLAKDVRTYGYYGGLRLVKATARVFYDHCLEAGIELPKRCFTVEYTSDIPRLVGLGGSSAICTAVFRALMEFYSVHIPT